MIIYFRYRISDTSAQILFLHWVSTPFDINSSKITPEKELPSNVSTEIFDWGFLYLLVGKVGGTKYEMEVQEF